MNYLDAPDPDRLTPEPWVSRQEPSYLERVRAPENGFGEQLTPISAGFNLAELGRSTTQCGPA